MENIEEGLKSLTVQENPEIEWLRNSVLGKTLKLILSDSREITGKLQCVDHLANVVLLNASENIPQLQIVRNLGHVIVPAKGISNILLQISLN
jgi:Small nuclear ribonucleoprotein (snRNP) homolog